MATAFSEGDLVIMNDDALINPMRILGWQPDAMLLVVGINYNDSGLIHSYNVVKLPDIHKPYTVFRWEISACH